MASVAPPASARRRSISCMCFPRIRHRPPHSRRCTSADISCRAAARWQRRSRRAPSWDSGPSSSASPAPTTTPSRSAASSKALRPFPDHVAGGRPEEGGRPVDGASRHRAVAPSPNPPGRPALVRSPRADPGGRVRKANRSDLSTRVSAVLDDRQRRGRAGLGLIAGAIGAAGLVVLTVAPVRAVAMVETVAAAKIADAVTGAHSSWIAAPTSIKSSRETRTR